MLPPTLNDMSIEIHSLAREKGWWPENQNIPEKICMIHTELSEAVDEYRKGKGVRVYYGESGKPEGMPVELADAMIRIMDLAGYLGIDLEKVINLKHEYNQSRAYRHGGKLA